MDTKIKINLETTHYHTIDIQNYKLSPQLANIFFWSLKVLKWGASSKFVLIIFKSWTSRRINSSTNFDLKKFYAQRKDAGFKNCSSEKVKKIYKKVSLRCTQSNYLLMFDNYQYHSLFLKRHFSCYSWYFVNATLLGRTNGMQYECAYYLNEVLFVSRRSIRG